MEGIEDAEAMESGSGDGVYVGSDAHVWRGAVVLASCRRMPLASSRIRKATNISAHFPSLQVVSVAFHIVIRLYPTSYLIA